MDVFMEAYPLLGAFIFTMVGIGIGSFMMIFIKKNR